MTTNQSRSIKVGVTSDFMKSLATNATPLTAISELIWNGFDAKAQHIKVILESNGIDGLHAIRISDDGDGIDANRIEDLFGGLGNSWKSKTHRHNGRSLHGKNGKGRFSAFLLGEKVEWNTTYLDGGTAKSYTISGSSNELTDFNASTPVEVKTKTLGTEVVIQNLSKKTHSLTNEKAGQDLTKKFAAYLTEYPGITLHYQDVKIDPNSVQINKEEFHLGDISLPSGKRAPIAITLIEWSIPTERSFELCDNSGVSLHSVPVGKQIKAPGYNFTVYVKSNYFRELDKQNSLALQELNNDVSAIISVVKEKVQWHFRNRILRQRSETIQRWKDEKIYPYEDKRDINSTEQIEREVFDILAVNVEDHLPSFENSPSASKKLTFRLLAQAIRENPDSVRTIMEEVLNLKKEEQDDLANLLKRTTLSKIITSARIVANRLDFIEALSDLLFNKESKKIFLERDQLHKALEAESWIFKEDFNLAASEKTLEDALKIHINKLGSRTDDDTNSKPVLREGEVGGRIDLMLSRAIEPTQGTHEYLVVELKRASLKINSDIISQIESYAIAVAQDDRFHQKRTRWTFLVVANDMDEHAKRKSRQAHRPDGLVFDSDELNISVWAKTWSEILNDARARLRFFSKQLNYQADTNSEREYLKSAHSKYIPASLMEAASLTIRDDEE